MFIDVCIPKNNENEFIKVAEKLGTKGLLFLYEGKEKNLEELEKATKIKLFTGTIVKKFPGKPGLYFAQGERKNAENKHIRFLYGFELLERKDSFHYKRSGINQIIAKIVKEKDKVVVLDMDKIISSKDVSVLLGRMQQILVMVKKYKLNVIVCSFSTEPMNLRSSKEYEALIRSLGFQEEAKKAVSVLNDIMKINSNL